MKTEDTARAIKSFMRLFVLVAFSTALLFACAKKTTTSGVSGRTKHTEDLSHLRKIDLPADTSDQSTPEQNINIVKDPNRFVEARHAVDKQLDVVLDSIDRINLAEGHIDGFTIQLYSGLQRDQALNAKKQIATTMPELDAEMQYVQPNFRVRVGKYYSRLDAHKDYMAVKRFFPTAILIPERIPLQKN